MVKYGLNTVHQCSLQTDDNHEYWHHDSSFYYVCIHTQFFNVKHLKGYQPHITITESVQLYVAYDLTFTMFLR